MNEMKPKEWHERLLASIDKEKIVESLDGGHDEDVTRIAVALARECDLFVHFQRLWKLRVSDLDETLGSDRYMQKIFVNKRALYKALRRNTPQQ